MACLIFLDVQGVKAQTISSTVSIPAPLTLTRSLYFGVKGADVSALQQFLKDKGFFTYPSITGFYGFFTQQAVTVFQRDNSIEPVGMVGSKTRAIINRLVANSNSSSIAASTSASPATAKNCPAPAGLTCYPGTDMIQPVSIGTGYTAGFGGGGGDVVAPAISTISDITAEAASGSGAVVTYTAPTATDTVDGARPVSCTPASGDMFAIGATTVTCGATDKAGNISHSSFIVTVRDAVAPAVSVSAPLSGATVGGSSVIISATASDAVGVAGVQFKVNGVTVGTEDTSSPYAIFWDSTATSSGAKSIVAVARDAAGNYATSSAVSFTVDNTPPSVSLTAPTSGATVAGSSVTLSATASDNVAVASVQFKVDGTNIGSAVTSAPYSTTWNSTGVSDGSHTLYAVAKDTAGNYATSSISVSTLQGFLASCSSVFDVTNLIKQSQTFTNAAWSVGNSGASNPVITANATTAPDNTLTASSLALPAVSGSNHYALLYTATPPSQTAGFPYLADIYVKGAVGGETLWISVTPNGSAYQRTKITATTGWQRVAVPWTPSGGAQYYVQIGVDLRDGSEAAQSAQTVYIWGAQLLQDTAERPYVVTTTASATQGFTISCPGNVKFRDFSSLAEYFGNPVIPQNAGSYNVNGADAPYARVENTIGGTYYAPSQGYNSSNWNNINLYTSTNLLAWTPYGSNPIITNSPGSWDDHYLLHPSVISIGGIWNLFYSAKSSGNFWGIGVATSSDFINWTKVGTTPLIPSTGTPVTNPGVPWVVANGSLLYMYVSQGNTNGSVIYYYTSSINDGRTWTFGGIALRTSTSDWETGTLGVFDPFVFKNADGWWEMIYTVGLNSSGFTQRLGYAVSQDGINWFKYQTGPIVREDSDGFPGDGVAVEDNGTLYLYYVRVGASSSQNNGYAATMPDH